jgi:hypothetical protein
MKRALGALVATLLVAGCGTTQLVSDPERKKVAAASVSPNVSKPVAMFYLGPGNVGMLFGALGGALAAPGIASERVAFQAFIEQNGISIEAIAREEVEAVIRGSGKLAVADDVAPGGATIVVSILQYGFGVPNTLSSRVVPIVHLKIELVSGGKVLWSASERLLTLGNPVEPVTPQALREDPKLIDRQWRLAVRHIATNLIGIY